MKKKSGAFVRTFVLACLLMALLMTSATSMAGPNKQSGETPIDMSQTYTNPLNLSHLEVVIGPTQLRPTDEGIADATDMLPFLEQETWVAADGRRLLRPSSVGFSAVKENNTRAIADAEARNYDGTIYLYASGHLQSGRISSLNVWSTTDYINWERHQMNLGVTAPTAVRVGDKYYLAGNSTNLYESDSPVGPWTDIGPFLKPDGTELRAGDVEFFLDDDGRLYMSFNIGAPIMAAELDAANPRQLISEPVVVFDFDPLVEWHHFGDNKQNFTFGYVEASQIFKVGDVYYLAVAAGGTEHSTYVTGISKSTEGPLTGYVPQDNNPIGYALDGNYPSAVYPDAGHGSFVQDDAGNLVFFYTIVVPGSDSGRRLGMDACYVDDADNIECPLSNTPQYVPTAENVGRLPIADSEDVSDIGLYNISDVTRYQWASSYAPGRVPFYAVDRSHFTWWAPADDDESRTFISGFGHPFNVYAVQILWKELGLYFTQNSAVQYTLEYMDPYANEWVMLVDKSDNDIPYAVDYVPLDEPVLTHAVRLQILGTTEFTDVGIRELRVFGENYTIAVEKGMID